MGNSIKRFLAMALAIVMVIGMMPSVAFAAETTQIPETEAVAVGNVAKVGNTEYATIDEAIAAWTNNTTLTLLANVTLSDVVKLKSTEHHTLDLGTYTMTAASGKNAIEITCEGRSSASYALTVNADATNPGGITANGKACIYYSKSGSTKDRPIIRIYNGVFNGSYSINSKSNGNTNCPQIWIYGGTFNGNVNLTKNMLRVFGGTFNGWINCTGDSSAYREISGGRFKSWQFMTADADNKFWVGTSKANYNVGTYVDDEGYLVVGGDVIIEAGDKFEAFSANYGGWSSYLKYSSNATNGLYYTSVEEAFADNNTTSGKVTVYVDELDMSGINYKGTIVVPEGKTLKITNAPEGLKTEGNVVIVKPDLKGSGTETDPYKIGSVDELIKFRDSVNAGETKYSAYGVYVVLTADIDLAGINWVGIGSINQEHGFMGNFDGKGFKIKNLTITNPTLDSNGYAYAGLFSITEGVAGKENVIKNLIIENVTISTTGHIVAAAIAYPYYTTVENVTVCGNINITGGDYTSGVLAYTRRCVNASNLTVSGNAGSTITGRQVVGGVISDIQMNGGLKANYSNFSASGVKISGDKAVGGISGIISGQALSGATVKNVELPDNVASVGIISGSMGDPASVTGISYASVIGTDKLFGTGYGSGEKVAAMIGNTYYATFADAYAAAKAGETITLLAPIVVAKGETLTLDKDVTIVYTSSVVGEDMITVRGTLNVAAGKITYINTDKTGNNVTVSTISCEPGSVLNVTGGTIENKTVYSTGSYAYAIDMLTNGSLGDVTATISGGEVYSDYIAIRQFNNGTACKNSLTITGGEIYGAKRAIQVHLKNDAAYLAISGGVIEAGEGGYALCLFPETATHIAVSGGKFVGIVYSGTNGFISGGTFDEAVAKAYVAKDHRIVMNDDGSCGVEEIPVYKVSTKAELDDALAVAKDGDVILLTADIDYGTTQLAIHKAITLDLGGHTLTTRNAYGGMSVKNNATVKNGTIVHASNTAAIKVWNATAFEDLVIDVQGKGEANKTIGGIVLQSGSTTRVGSIKNVTIKGAALTNGIETYNCGDATENVIGYMKNVTIDAKGTGLLISAPCGTATDCNIKGGTNGIEIWIKGNYSASLTLADSKVEGGVYAHDEFSSNPSVTNNGTLTLTVDEDTTGASAEDVTLTLNRIEEEQVDGEVLETIIENARAKVNGTYHATLAEAFAAAKDGDTITLLADIEASAVILIDKSLTINGNGHKVTSTATRVFRVTTANVEVTLNDVNMVSNTVRVGTNDIRGISIDDVTGVKLTLNNCSVDFTDASATDWSYAVNVVGGSGHNVTINGGTYEGANVVNVRGANQTVVVKDATLTSLYPINDQYFGACIYVAQNQDSSVEATGNTFSGSNAKAFNVGYTPVTESNNTDNTTYVVAKIGNTYYTSLKAAFEAAQDGDTIKVLQNTKLDEMITNTKKVTLDLNGKTITGTDNTTKNFSLIDNRGELTVTGNGTMTLKATVNSGWNRYSAVLANNPGGKLVVENGTIEHLGGTDMAYAIDNLTNGKGTYAETIINGGTIKSPYRAIRQFLNGVEAQNILTVNGGTIEGGNKSIWMQDPSKNANTGKLTVTAGATLNGDVYLSVTAGSTEWPVSVSIATAALTNGSTVLTGNVPEGYVVEASNGIWGVREANYVAEANGVKYESLQAAINAGGTITFLADITENVTISKNVIIDGDEFKYTGTMTVNKGLTVTVRNVNFVNGGIDKPNAQKSTTGKYTITNCTFDGEGVYAYAFRFYGANTVTIEKCTVKNYLYSFLYVPSAAVNVSVMDVTVENCPNYAVYFASGVNNATFENLTVKNSNNGFIINNTANRAFTIKNVKMENVGTAISESKGTNTITCTIQGENDFGTAVVSEYAKVVLIKDATLTAPEGITATTDVKDYKVTYEDGTYKLVKAEIAAIGSVKYSSLQDAIDAATPGATIKLLCDAEGPGVVINKNITIDFGNYTYTLTEGVGSTGTESNGFQILQGHTVKLINGTLKVHEDAADKFYILIQNYANLTVQSMTLDGTNLDKWSKTDGDSYTLSNNSGNVNVNKSTVIANDDGEFAFAFDVCDQTSMGYSLPKVIIYASSVIEGNIEAVAKSGNTYYATLQQAVDAVNAGSNIYLVRDSSGAGVVIDKNVNIDFKGFTYTLTSGVGSGNITSNGFQILKGNTVALKNGTLKVADSAADKFYILIQNYADLTVNKMTLDGTNLDKWSKTDGDSYTLSNNSGKVTIGAGTKIIANNDGALAFAFDACDKSAWGYELPVVTVNKTAVIEGNVEAAAKIGNVYYATLQQAINAAANKQTVTLMSDIEVGASDIQTVGNLTTLFNVEGKSITLDMNGKTIAVNYDSTTLLYSVIHVADGASLTVKGDGKINLTTGDTLAGSYDCVAYMFLKNGNEGSLTIENGTFTANKVEDSMVYTTGDKVVHVKGGTWTLGNVGTGSNGAPWIFNTKGQNANSILVSGGTFNFNVAKQYYAREVAIVDANGNLSYVTDNGNGTWTVTGKTAEVGIVTKTWNANYLYGYATFKDAVAAIGKGAPETTIQLQKDITVKGQFIGHSYAQKVVIDLNGHKMSSTDKTLTVYRAGTEVTIKNGTVHGNTTGGTIQVTYGGKLTLGENVTITSGGSANAIKVDANSTLIVDKDTTYVLGGKNDLVVADGAKVQISAGYFKKAVNANWCAEGYVPTEKLDNGYYSVMYDGEAMIGDQGYETLQEAIAAAKSGDTIKVVKDITVNTSATVTNSGGYATIYNVADKAITIDLNGKKIDVTVNAADVADDKNAMLLGVFAVDINGSLTLTGKGSVNANAVDASMTSDDSHLYSLMIVYGAGGKLVVEDGEYSANSVSASLVYSQYNKVVFIEGGSYMLGNVGTDKNGSPWIFNAKGQNTANIIVNGGSFNADIQHQYYPFEVQMPETKALKIVGGMYTVVPAVAYVTEREWSSKWYTNNVGYATLEEAIAACEGPKTRSGKTSEQEVVVLLTDITLDDTLKIAAGKTVVLDLNGKTISQTKECTASYEMIANNGNLTIKDSVGTGKIVLTDTGAGDPNFGWGSYTVRNSGTLVVDGGTIEFVGNQKFAKHCSLAIFQYSGSTTINGGKIINNAYRSVRLWKGTVTINGGTFEGQVWVHCVDNSAKLTINGGSFAPAKNGGDASSVFVNNATYTAELSITGGYFATKVGANNVNALAGCITGGVFSDAAKENTASVLFAENMK